MENTRIEWTDSSWNPISGCRHECNYCYARGIANRYKGCDISKDGQSEYDLVVLKEPLTITHKDGKTRKAPYPYGFTPTLHEYRLNDLQTKKFGKTIFVGSMSDIFGSWVPDDWIYKVFNACLAAPEHRYLFLTKNPDRYVGLHEKGLLPEQDNFWYGSTATTKDSKIFKSDIHHTFVSMEPILGEFPYPDSFMAYKDEWVIMGAETGNRAGKVVPERSWIERYVQFCKDAHIPVFMKDSMTPIWGEDLITEFPWED